MIFSRCLCAVGLFVGDVAFDGIPSKIGNFIVAGISVIVASLHTFRAWTDEGFENKAMYVFGFVFWSQSNQQIPMMNLYRCQLFPRIADGATVSDDTFWVSLHPQTPHAAVVPYPITRIAFDFSVLDCRLVSNRHTHLASGECVAGEDANPLRLKTL